MTKILLMGPSPEFQAIMAMNLQVYTGSETILTDSAERAIESLESHRPDLIIVDGNEASTIEKEKINSYIQSHFPTLPFLELNPEKEQALFSAVKETAKKLNISARHMASQEMPDFFSFNLNLFVPELTTTVDLYYLKDKNYIKILSKGKEISPSFLRTIQDLGKTKIYIRSQERLKFVNGLTAHIISRLKQTKGPLSEKLVAINAGHQFVMEQAKELGIADHVIQVTNATIQNMIQMTRKSESINTLLETLISKDKSYNFQLSFLIGYIGMQFLNWLKWQKPDQRQMLCYMAFFHNIVLTKDEYSHFQSDEELNEDRKLTLKEKALVKGHAYSVSRLISHSHYKDTFPKGLTDLLKQHHGDITGKSLSRISKNLHPLTILFILAEEWSHVILQYKLTSQKKLNKEKVVKHISGKYQQYKAFKDFLPLLSKLDI